jgi:hypothetical protein
VIEFCLNEGIKERLQGLPLYQRVLNRLECEASALVARFDWSVELEGLDAEVYHCIFYALVILYNTVTVISLLMVFTIDFLFKINNERYEVMYGQHGNILRTLEV